MSGEEWGLVLTFILACGSACVFLMLRCEGKGRVFGRSSRRWALAVIALTGAISTSGAIIVVAIGHFLPSAIVGLGIIGSSPLSFSRFRDDLPERHSLLGAVATLGLVRLLTRLDDEMAEDKARWCERYIDPHWEAEDLLLAADSYYFYLGERLSARERERYRIAATMTDIEDRLKIVQVIDGDGDRPGERAVIAAAFRASPLAAWSRYEKYLDSPGLLGQRLRHDARRDVERLLAAAYCARFTTIGRYAPPTRLAATITAAARPRPGAAPARTRPPAP